ncbi:MAG: hypothetical protein KA810_07990 [Pyrinomonadaceae bacterium]|nr:hypothetical protein [Pyrinomonadaceae bacterium]
MLPSNHLLKNGRYSIDRSICIGQAGTIYLATDTLRNATVAIIERGDNPVGEDISSERLARIQHEGLLRISDDFEDKSCRYSATEPVLTSAVSPPRDASSCRAMFDHLRAILQALSGEQANSRTSSGIAILPEMLMLTADGKLKLLYTGSTGFDMNSTAAASSFASLETVWESLDHITQKAIYNSYDERSLALLESPTDARSDLYSLGAVFYKILTGIDPISAVERSIEMLDSNADPLRSPTSSNPVVSSEQSKFIERMLEVKRENRFISIEDALSSLPSPPEVAKPQSKPVVPEPEDFPLLELPSAPVVIQTPSSASGFSAKTELHVLETAAVDTAAAFRPPFAATEQVFEPMPLPKPVPAMLAQEVQAKVEPKAEPRSEPKEVFSSFEPTQPASDGAMKYVTIGAGALVIAAGIGWAVLSGPRATAGDPSASMAAPQTVVQEQKPIAPSEVAPTNAAEPVSVATDTNDTANVPDTTKPRVQIADTRPAPSKPTKPAAKSEAKPAKKLTVDDLIN